MRNLHCDVTRIRRQVFREVAKLAYEGGDFTRVDKLPYTIIPGEVGKIRESIFLERAIVGERIRLAMGLPLRNISEHNMVSDNIEESAISEKYYEPPLLNIIKYACNSCPPTHYEISNLCQGCIARHCINNCPKDAISIRQGRAQIDQDKCIKCGKCHASCSYHAIIKFERPCAEACGMNAIGRDEYGRAEIDQDKCVSCGMCLVNCPFGAIVEKGQLFQLINAINEGENVIAIIAPALWGQFGTQVTPGQIQEALNMVGFSGVREVAVGADLCSISEAQEFINEVPDKLRFMATSCCPAWAVMAKKEFPEFEENISMTLTPMVFTARLCKMYNPDAKVCFIGPCLAKKLEASRETVRSMVDFVITFEEFQGMLDAKDINVSKLPDNGKPYSSSKLGIGFAAAGGVAESVKYVIKQMDPDREVRVVHADSLKECRKVLKLAKAGKYEGCLIEGMACPGGCVAGGGTIQPPEKAGKFLTVNSDKATYENPLDSKHIDHMKFLKKNY